MAKVQVGDHEIDEEAIRSSVALRSQIESWMKNPAARRKLLEARKAAEPDAKIPELDNPDPIEERFKATQTEIAALKKQMEDDASKRDSAAKLGALQDSIEKGLAALRRDQRLTDEGVVALRKIMDEEGIVKPEIAWAVFSQRHPPENPISPRFGAWGFMDAPTEGGDNAEDIKALIASKGENEAVLRKMVNGALKDARSAA